MAVKDLSAAEVGRRGERIYEQNIRPLVEPHQSGMFLVLDVETGEYAVGDDILALTRSLRDSRPEATLYSLRIGYEDTGRLGGGFTSEKS